MSTALIACDAAAVVNICICLLNSLPAAPPVLYEYLISVELNVSDVAVINQLRTILNNISYPIIIMDSHIQLSDVNISTGRIHLATCVGTKRRGDWGW